ncbi:hypothetical protein [Phaeovulum vinaykumarii]|uniref:hypothetical protein n=1 Tax=Phaeovulum vinaykumarii TaxID=407234 RepID=UPI0009708393|nr:hypothetical protein [Phaeovulum vinaykumarii]
MTPVHLCFPARATMLAALNDGEAPRWPVAALQWVEVALPPPGLHVNALWDGGPISARSPPGASSRRRPASAGWGL